jgi:hypothetical protein
MVYYLDFLPKDTTVVVNRSTLLDDPWCVRLFRKPDDEMMNQATAEFEKRHGVKSWEDIASSRRVVKFWFP